MRRRAPIGRRRTGPASEEITHASLGRGRLPACRGEGRARAIRAVSRPLAGRPIKVGRARLQAAPPTSAKTQPPCYCRLSIGGMQRASWGRVERPNTLMSKSKKKATERLKSHGRTHYKEAGAGPMGRKVVAPLPRKVGFPPHLYVVLLVLIAMTPFSYVVIALSLVALTLSSAFHACGLLMGRVVVVVVLLLAAGLMRKDWLQYCGPQWVKEQLLLECL